MLYKIDKQGNALTCKRSESLYGLKQSGKNWYLTAKTFHGPGELGFAPAIQCKCLFIKDGENGIAGMVSLGIKHGDFRDAGRLLGKFLK